MTYKELTILEQGTRVWAHIIAQIWGVSPWLDLTYSKYRYEGVNLTYKGNQHELHM